MFRKNTGIAGGLQREKAIEARWCYLMLACPLIGFLVLQIYPIIWTFRWAFYSYNGTPQLAKFIGLRNFKTFFTSDLTYWQAWLHTLRFALYKIPIEMTLAMLLALFLNERKGAGLFRSLYYVPNVVSVAIIGVVFSNLFSYFGVINAFLIKSGVIKEGVDWFSTTGTAWVVIVFGAIWNTFGINVMYCMAALSNVPKDVYESADLDGANAWTKFWKITIPMILPMLQIILLMSVTGTLSVNDYIIVLTNGGPNGTTSTVMAYMTKSFVPGFATTATPAIGYGCSMSLVTTVIFLGIGFAYNRINKYLSNVY